MTGIKPFFITGANAIIKIGGVTVAFATDVSYRISVKHASPRVLGRFEVERHQPLAYDVSGTFTIFRYVNGVYDEIGLSPTQVKKEQSAGNGIGNMGNDASPIADLVGLLDGNGLRINDQLDPSAMLRGSVFDIDIYQRASQTVSREALDNFQFAKLRRCRITEAELRVQKRSAATQTFRFVAQYADEDTFTAGKSGVGQEL